MAYPITRPQSVSTPYAYQLGKQESFTVESISATWDGTSASGSFVPCVSVYSQDGLLLGRYKGDITVSAGDSSAEGTFAPFLKGASQNNFTTIGSGPSPTPVTYPLSVTLAIRALQPDAANFGVGVGHFGHRVLIPQTGYLHDLSLYIATVTAGTQIEVAVLDTVATNRTILYKSGYVAVGAGAQWQTFGDPGLLVQAGEQYDIAVAISNTTTVLWIGGLVNTAAFATSADLPNGFDPVTGGGKNVLTWFDSTSPVPYGVTTTVPETSLVPQQNCPLIIGRIADT